MSQVMRVNEFAGKLIDLASPIDPFDMPLLDAHGATLAHDVYLGEQLVLRAGSRIRSTQIGLAASIGLDRLPTRPQPRVVILSAGADLVEPGQKLDSPEDEFETNSWMLTTSAKEAGAVGYRVHAIPETAAALKAVIEDQLVRADLLVISGETKDESFELIFSVLSQLGEVTAVKPAIENSGAHCYGLIGPDKTPVVVLPGEPIAAYISAEIFIRPMIRNMMGLNDIHRPTVRGKLLNSLTSPAGVLTFARSKLHQNKDTQRYEVSVLPNQDNLLTLSDAQGLIVVPENQTSLSKGDDVEVLLLERRFI